MSNQHRFAALGLFDFHHSLIKVIDRATVNFTFAWFPKYYRIIFIARILLVIS